MLFRKLFIIGALAFLATLGALGATSYIPNGQVLQSTVHDGISLDFTKSIENGGCCYVKAPGQPAQRGKFTDLFTFTRNSVGTFLGSNGLIQYANENVMLQSQDLATTWTNSESTENVNAIVAPDGTTTADAIVDNTNNASHYVNQVVAVEQKQYVYSAYLKQGTKRYALLFTTSGTFGWAFDLQTCALGTGGTSGINAPADKGVTSVGNGWCRAWIAVNTAAAASPNFRIYPIDNDGSGVVSYVGTTAEATYVWGVQLQRALSLPGTYRPTTTAIKYDQPRIEYDASGNLLGLLIEGARTNIAIQSEDFTNAAWVNTNTTDAANSAVAPDGNTTADTITASGANGTIAQSFQASTTNAVRTFSVYLKRLTGSGNVTLEVGRTASSACTVNSSWNRCSITDTVLAGTYAVVANLLTVTATGHGLITGDAVRLDYTSGTAADFSCASVITLTADTFTCAQTTGDTTGNVNLYANLGRIKIATDTDAVYAWGGQGETSGAGVSVLIASSYISTTTATVARAADTSSRTFGSEYIKTAGTTVVEMDRLNITSGGLGIFGSGSAARNLYVPAVGGSLAKIGIYDGTTECVSTSSFVANVMARGASAFDANGMSVALGTGAVVSCAFDGVFGAAETTVIIGDTGAGANAQPYIHVRNLNYYPTRQPNSFLQQKTQPGPQSALKWPSYAANDNAQRKAG